MFKSMKLAAALGMALSLASVAANATTVPAGTLTISPIKYNPVVDPTAGTTNLAANGGVKSGVSYFGGTGQFANSEDPPVGAFSNTTISFSTIVGGVVDYSGANAVNNFFTFYDTDANGNIIETYEFDLDQSITTTGNAVTGQGTTIGLYFLGDMTATGSEGTFTDLTPTALTLTLNKTGGSNWTYSATLSNPPPGSGVTTPTVPEPASMTLLGGGLAVLGFVRRRRARK